MEISSEDEIVQTPPSKLKYLENHYISLPSQGNVYSLVQLTDGEEECKILVATLQGKIFCIRCSEGNYSICKDPLSGIPNKADIVSMDGLYWKKKFCIGLTMVVKENSPEQLINFYTDFGTSVEEVDVDEEVSSNATTTLRIPYIPYALHHSFLFTKTGEKELIWLLSGSDGSIHVFRPTSEGDDGGTCPFMTGPFNNNDGGITFHEEVSTHLFPEFSQIIGVTLHFDVWNSDDRISRITATSGESGNVHLFRVSLADSYAPVVTSSRCIQFDFPASSLRIFERRTQQHSFSSHSDPTHEKTEVDNDKHDNSPLICVATAIESCFLYCGDGFEKSFHFAESDTFDVITCCLVADVDFDGFNEVVLGTYGQVVLIYKENRTQVPKWVLHQTLSLPSPALAMVFGDVLGDGVNELIVHSMAGLHIFQSDPEVVSSIIIKRIQALSN